MSSSRAARHNGCRLRSPLCVLTCFIFRVYFYFHVELSLTHRRFFSKSGSFDHDKKQKEEEAKLMAENDEVQDLYKLLSEYGNDLVPKRQKHRLDNLTETYIPEFHNELDKAADHVTNTMPKMASSC